MACIRNAIKNLDEESIKILMRKSFEIGIDYSFTGIEANGKTHKKISILSGPKEDPYMIYDADLIKAKTDQEKNALIKLDK